MKKLVYIFLIINCWYLLANAQSGWFNVTNPIYNIDLNRIQFTSVNTGYAIGPIGTTFECYLFKTTNGGNNWDTSYINSWCFSLFFINDNTGYIVGANYGTPGIIKKTTNGGLNWSIILEGLSTCYFTIFFVDQNTGYAGGKYNVVVKTTDGGNNWISKPGAVGHEFNDIYFLNAETGFVAGSSNTINKTTNGGDNWVQHTYGYYHDYRSIYFVNGNTGYSCSRYGDYSFVSKTTNTGINWDYSDSIQAHMSSIFFVNSNTGYISGYNHVYKTTNTGLNWIIQTPSGINTAWNSITFLNENTGFITGSGGIIMKTTTGGEIPTFTVSGNVKYADNNQPVTSGYVKALKLNMSTLEFETVDSTGILPNGTYSLPNVRIDSVYIRPYPNSTPIVDFIPTFYPSSINWETATKLYINSNLTNIDVGVIRINVTQSQGTISGTIFKQQNAGLYEALVYATLNNVIKGFAISGINGNYTINNIPAGTYNLKANRPGYYSDSTTVTATGGAMSNINFTLLPYYTSVKNISSEVPEKFQLHQNYPNPFNPVTKIKFDIPMDSRFRGNDNVLLKVYDLLGREVATLINEMLQPGTYEVTFDGSRLASGMYFCRMNTDNFSQTIRIVLLK
ncbi:MAG: carboxypeptidase regulatory-like domain-containing protein [Ignavibacteria bacterium]|nr:carboxypeptidase regulatory-like domain-containing protein [Ignavibacteria bacterium]